jgi:hypothetical protein
MQQTHHQMSQMWPLVVKIKRAIIPDLGPGIYRLLKMHQFKQIEPLVAFEEEIDHKLALQLLQQQMLHKL